MLHDPFPKQLWLSASDVRVLLGFDRSTWHEFLQDPSTGFPRPLDGGATAKGRRQRYDKIEVYKWMMGRPRVEIESPNPSETVRKRPKPSGGVADE